MNGFVKIESTRGDGTAVKVSLPQEVIDPAQCLALKEDFSGDILFFTDPSKSPY